MKNIHTNINHYNNNEKINIYIYNNNYDDDDEKKYI